MDDEQKGSRGESLEFRQHGVQPRTLDFVLSPLRRAGSLGEGPCPCVCGQVSREAW